MRKYLHTLIFILTTFSLVGQLENGEPAKNFQVKDINGTVFNLHTILESGRAAILDFSASWCSICWNYHNSPSLKDTYAAHGPSGTNKAMVFFIEGDLRTSEKCIYGTSECTGGSIGNWTLNTPYPVINLTNADEAIIQDYKVVAFPLIYIVSPDKRVFLTGRATKAQFDSYILNSFALRATASVTNSSCSNNGSIVLNVTGGFGQNNYKWSNGATTKDISNLGPGNYSVTITDGNNYFKTYDYVLEGSTISLANSTIKHPLCFGDNNGSITASPLGGAGNYTYKWSTGSTFQTITNLAPGMYSLVVTDGSGCSTASSYIVNEPLKLELNLSSIPSSCKAKDGKIIAIVVGGSGQKLFKFNDDTYSSMNLWLNLDGGLYSVSAKDDQGCTVTKTIKVDKLPTPRVNATVTNVLDCINPIIKISGSSTIINDTIKFLWTSLQNGIQGRNDMINVEVNRPGDYQLKATDILTGCADSISVTVKRNDLEAIPDFAFSLRNGVLELLNTSIKSDSVRWKINNGAFERGNILRKSFLNEGKVEVCIEAQNICGIQKKCSTIDYLKRFKATTLNINPSCFAGSNGAIRLQYSGGPVVGNLQAKWTGPNGFVSSELEPLALKKGNYVGIINDQSDIKDTVKVTLIEPTDINIVYSTKAQNGTQENGSISLEVTGGTPPYKYLWNNGDTLKNISNIKAGTYRVAVIDSNNCIKTLTDIKVQLVNATADLGIINSINLYPNPTSKYLNIAFSQEARFEGKMIINDANGKVLLTKETSGNGHIEAIDISSFPPAIYTIQFIMNNLLVKKSFVVLK
jgi:hypothetical protein